MTSKDVLHLFSSNIRPLYEQDVLNVLAAPTGLRYRFRYGRKRITDDIANLWGEDLVGRKCVVYFSLQQPHEYQEAVFFPIRTGTVLNASREAGDIFLVEFAVEGAIGLREPLQSQGTSAPSAQAYATEVRAFREFLADQRVPRPYEAWASLGPDVTQLADAPIDINADDGALFNRMARYLAGTLSYQHATFMRIRRITTRAGNRSLEVSYDREVEAFRLQSGHSYRLEVILSQPNELHSPTAFKLSAAEDVVRLVGPATLEMAGSYDVAPVPFLAVELSSSLTRDGTIEIGPELSAQGPRLLLPIRVEPNRTRNAVGLGASAVGLIVLGLAGVFGDLKIAAGALVIIGSVLAVGVPAVVSGRLPWNN